MGFRCRNYFEKKIYFRATMKPALQTVSTISIISSDARSLSDFEIEELTWFERISMMVILLNCVTLGMYQPCKDEICATSKCQILQGFDHFIFAFFAIEMLIKVIAMGMTGKGAYLGETWNRLDCFIVISGAFEYCLDVGSINLSAIRTIRVLRPLRAINRIPSMRILVMLLLDTLPMLGNVLLLCFFVFFIFGIVGVQLWSGLLRHRCHVDLPSNVSFPSQPPLSTYYQNKEPEKDYICSRDKDNGMHRCVDLPPYIHNGLVCNTSAIPFSNNTPSNISCINWNQYYTDCRPGDKNPFQGAISFDNIGLAWVAIFLVISLEGWTDIMYYIQDTHSFWDWIYFVLLIVIGSFFMINLCLVVIATQFSETKKREMERMKMERARYHSTSTLYSNSAGSEPVGCYTETIKYLAHLCRRAKRRTLRWYRQMRRRRRKDQEHRLPRSISLRRTRHRPPWQPGQSSLKRQDAANANNNNYSDANPRARVASPPEERSCDSLHAPCASPEVSDIDPLSSPRRPNLLKIPQGSSSEIVKPSDCTIRIEPTDVEPPQKPQPSSRLLAVRSGSRHPSNGGSRRTSQLTCAELLALSGAQSAALAASLASNYAMQKFYCTLTRGEKNYSAPQLLFYYPENNSDPASQVDDIWTESDFDSDLEDDFCTEPRGRCYDWWQTKQARLKRFVNHDYFQKGILTAILVNTLSMGIEYHNQPDELTLAVEISNLVFTAIFALEMLLKILAEGFFGYISSGFNVFDGVIVVLSVVELFQSSGSGLSVLRTFRLLRILKLVRFMPALRRQLVIMLRTLDNVAIFFSLLILFIFIFSILGMNLFGCKFCQKGEDDTTQCDRKNFDSLLWALVTVFQILTQEDWNVVLFNGMEKTSHWAALYFVALMTFGNYVLFNLLVAILVEGFSTQGEDRKNDDSLTDNKKKPTDQEKGDNYEPRQIKHISDDDDPKDNIVKETRMRSHPPTLAVTRSEKVDSRLPDPSCFPPIITHTAATPQGSPNATMEPFMRDLNNKLSPLMAFNISASSIDSIDKSSNPMPFPDSPLLTRTASNRSSGSACLSIPRAAVFCTPEMARRDTIPITERRTPSPSLLARQFSAKRAERKGSQGSISKLDRQGSICSWRALRRRKKFKEHLVDSDSGSLTDGEHDDEIILNNMTSSQIGSSNCHGIDYRHCNGGVGVPTFLNTPNNKRPIATMYNPINTPKTLSPQNSIKSHSSPLNISRKQSLNSYHAPLSPQNSLGTGGGGNSYLPSRQNSIAGSSMKEELFKSNNLAEIQPQTKVENNQFLEKPEVHSKLCFFLEPRGCFKDRDDWSLLVFAPENKIRIVCSMLADKKWFDYIVLVFIALNCITLAMERPNIPPESVEKIILNSANYIFTFVFGVEMLIKVIAKGLWYGDHAYFKSGWNVMDGTLVIVSLVDLFLSFVTFGSTRIFGILRVFRLLRSLRPLRVINRAPGLKLVVQTLLSSLRPIGNIVLICCTFFIIFGILGVQLFKGSLYYCVGPEVKNVRNKTDCLANPKNTWVNRRYNFDNLGQALMALFVLSSKDGWVNIMYSGLDAVGVDQQPQENYSEWRLLYFISFLLLVAFFVLNMFVGVVVENFHRCREEQEKEEKARRMAKRARKLEKKRRKMREPPYYINYSKPRLLNHNIVTSKYFDLAIAAVIGLNVVTMAMEFYMMPPELEYALKIFNYFFTAVFILEAIMKVIALGIPRYLHDRWNQLDIFIVMLSVVGIVLEEMESEFIPINPTIIRVMRVLRIARVLKLLKMAKGIRALLDTVMQALPQVGNLGLLFFLLFFIFAALGVELFGRLECTDLFPCEGLGEHAHFRNFGMAFLTLFRVATGDNWNGIMKDTLRDNCDSSSDCVRNCCVSPIIAPLYFVVFVLMAQFVLVNVVVAVLMKHLEESHKQMDDDLELEIEQELVAEAERGEPARKNRRARRKRARAKAEQNQTKVIIHRPIVKMSSLPANFTFTFDPDKSRDLAIEFPTAVSIHVTDAGQEEPSNATLCTLDPFSTGGLTPPASSFPVNNVNIRQASPDEPVKKVAVADLSHIPLTVIGSVPNLCSPSSDLCFSPPEPRRSLPGSVMNLYVPTSSTRSSLSSSLSSDQAHSCPSSPMRPKSPLEARMSWQSPSECSSYLENAENHPSLSEISCPTYQCSSGSTRSDGVPSLERDKLAVGGATKELQSPTISEGSDWTSESSRTLENLLDDGQTTPGSLDGVLESYKTDLTPEGDALDDSKFRTFGEGLIGTTGTPVSVVTGDGEGFSDKNDRIVTGEDCNIKSSANEVAEVLGDIESRLEGVDRGVSSTTRCDQLSVRHPSLAAVAHKLDKTYSESSDETLKADQSGTPARSSLETQDETVEPEVTTKDCPKTDEVC